MSLLNKASLIQIPSGYKDGTLYSAKPTNGDGDFTFSRGSNLAATRVNSDGLIEKGRENLILQSNSFDTTWAKSVTATLTSGQTGYDGSSNAWLFGKDATGFINLNQAISSLTGVGTLSIYAKANTNSNIIVRCIGGTDAQGFFDLSNGTLAAPSANCIDTNIEDVGNGWYRCSITFNTSSTTSVNLYPDYPFGGTNAGNIYIQDAQLEQGLVATDYIETTTTTAQAGILEDMPRLDYSGGTCPSLLLEPQRSNIVIQSEYYSASSWQNVGVTITNNATTSPDGFQNASKIVATSGGGSARFQDYFGPLTGTHTYSVFIKSTGVATRVNLQTNDIGGATFSVPASGTPTLYAQGTNVGDPFIEDYGDGWYRVGFSFNPTGGAVNNYFQFYPDSEGSYRSVFAFGAQVEAGSYPTSYIPTYGASVTRGADSCEVTSASALIGQTEGTFFGEFTFKSTEITNRLFSISGANWDTIGHIRFDMINLRPQAKIRTTGADVAEVFGTEDIAIDSVVKFAVVYTSTTLKAFVNGEQVGSTDTLSGSLPSMDEIVIDALGGEFSNNSQNNQLNPYKQALVFKTALTDDECIQLTTL